MNYLDDKFGVWFGDYEPHQTFSPHLRIGGVKIFADSAWTNEMYMTEPHADPGTRGDVYWTPDELTDLVRSLHDDGWQMATHTCGDAAHDWSWMPTRPRWPAPATPTTATASSTSWRCVTTRCSGCATSRSWPRSS